LEKIERLLHGIHNPEGPVSLCDGSWLFTEMDIGAISHVTKDGKLRHIAITGLPNGMTLGEDGKIWVAEAKQRALMVVDMEGISKTVSTGSADAPFLLPNDLCFGPDGMIYMTDSGALLEDFRKAEKPMGIYDLPFDGRLYVIDPATGESKVLDRGFRLTNGIAFGMGGEYLYVAETLTGEIFRYRYGEWKRESFGNVLMNAPLSYGRVAGPDGMAFDTNGLLYVTVIAQDITVLAQDGTVAFRINLPGDNPTNLAFDVNGANQMLVTEAANNELLVVETSHPGLPLYTEIGRMI